MNIINKIRPIIETIQQWMKQLGYSKGFDKWIKSYHSSMSEWDKSLIAKAFKISREENSECIIFVAINAYGIGIGNPDI